MRKNILKIYGGLLIAALIYLAYYYLIGSTIPCFYLSNYGIQCPGCGLTRMMFALMRLDFAAAFSYNPVGFVAMMVWNAVAVLCFWSNLFRNCKYRRRMMIMPTEISLIDGGDK